MQNMINNFIKECANGNIENIRKIINEKSFDINTVLDSVSNNMLLTVIRKNRIDIAQLLIENGINVNHQNAHFDNTPLIWCCKSNKKRNFIKLLLENGANVNAKNFYGLTPLMYAIINNKLETVKLLLEYGADVNITDTCLWGNTNGDNALIYASRYDKIAIAELLIKHGADINFTNNIGKDAIAYAEQYYGYYDKLALILRCYKC